MSEMYVFSDGHRQTIDAEQLSLQPTIDMGSPVNLLGAAVRLDGSERVGVAWVGMPPLLRSQLHPDDVSGAAVTSDVGELRPVDSMPQLTPVMSETFAIGKKDVDTEDGVPMVSQRSCPHGKALCGLQGCKNRFVPFINYVHRAHTRQITQCETLYSVRVGFV